MADTLGMREILIHPLSGLLSAYGIGLSALRASRERSLERPLVALGVAAARTLAETMRGEAADELAAEGASLERMRTTARLHLRYEATEVALPVSFPDSAPGSVGEVDADEGGSPVADLRRAFEAAHLQRFGFTSPEKRVVIAVVEVEAEARGDEPAETPRGTDGAPAEAVAETRFYSQGAWHEAGVWQRDALAAGQVVAGPALIIEANQTVVVEPGWSSMMTPRGDLVLTRIAAKARETVGLEADPVLLEVFGSLFMGIAEEMGEALRATAQSVNIKERLDFSCAVFDGEGHLVANAPHVPVHLGSMESAVETVIRERGADLRPGDVDMLNAPYAGGTHLPDITVVTPVFLDGAAKPAFYVASRGHHADIGGTAPGSMSPDATTIEQEGVYIDCVPLVREGRFLEAETLALLTGARYPARNPAQNIADLKAQVAANARGRSELLRLVGEFGTDVVASYMAHVQTNAEEAVRRLIGGLKDGHFRAETDGGWAIEVAVTIDRARRTAKVDFTGTSPQQPTNVNAPEPVARAAVLYVVRVLLDAPIPLNAGCLRPIEIVIPDGSMLCGLGRAGLRTGHHEQPDLRQRPRAVLRDHLLRRPGRLRQRGQRLRRRSGRARPHDEHAIDRSRGPGEPLSRRPRTLFHPPWLGGQGPLEERRRDAARHPLPGAHALRDPVGLPQDKAVRACGRRAGGDGPQRHPAPRRQDGGVARSRERHARAGRCGSDLDTDRRRRRRGVTIATSPLNSGFGMRIIYSYAPRLAGCGGTTDHGGCFSAADSVVRTDEPRRAGGGGGGA
jgi:5-oxoprolinase (ATP-hydrolysing)